MKIEQKGRRIEILLVEDNPGDVRLLTEVMKESAVSNNLTVVANGVEALAFLRREGRYAGSPSPDLILLDLNLPGKNGCEVLAEVKADSRLRRIPVVVLTSSDAEEEVHRAYDLHANCFIAKPVGLDQFTRVVREIQEFWLNLVTLPARREE